MSLGRFNNKKKASQQSQQRPLDPAQFAGVRSEAFPMICLWSGKNTSDVNAREHIIPKNIGGKQRLPKGYVSDKYNNWFSEHIDKALRYHPAFATSYQIHDHIKSRKRKERKGAHPKEYIEKGNFKSICTKNGLGKKELQSINPCHLSTDTLFMRALNKCAANILAFRYGVEHVRHKYMPLIDFVLTGNKHLQWSYAVSFSNPFFPGFNKEFEILKSSSLKKSHITILILHASGIWAISPECNGLNYQKINALSDSVYELLGHSHIEKYFGIKHSKRICIGKACFYWVKPNLPVEITSPTENKMVFVNCKICGQILKTEIALKHSLKSQLKEKHGDDQYHRVYLSRSQKPPNIGKLKVTCLNCSCDYFYNFNDFFVFEFNKEGTFEI